MKAYRSLSGALIPVTGPEVRREELKIGDIFVLHPKRLSYHDFMFIKVADKAVSIIRNGKIQPTSSDLGPKSYPYWVKIPW